MNYIFFMVTVLISIYSYTFARWLWQQGNTVGAVGVYILIAVCLTLPIYRIITAG